MLKEIYEWVVNGKKPTSPEGLEFMKYLEKQNESSAKSENSV